MPATSYRVSRVAASILVSFGILLGCAACSADAVGGDAAEKPALPEQITIALPGALANIYPGQEAGILNYYVASTFSEGLVGLGSDGSLQPALAEEWEQPDASTLVFKLREGAKFHDGSPVAVEDVIASIEKANDANTSPGYAGGLDGIESVEETGEDEITIKLTEPSANFAVNLGPAGLLNIAPKSFWDENPEVGTASSLFVGSGPYRVVSFDPSAGIELELFEDWWGEKPEIEKVSFAFIADENSRLLARQSGQIDVAFNVPTTQAAQWEEAPNTVVEATSDLSFVGLRFNPSIKPFDDLHVRKAIAHAFDREAVVKTLLRGHGEVATAITTPESIASLKSPEVARRTLSEAIEQYDFDLDKAREELSKSEYPDGFEISITTPATGPQLRDAAQALAQNLAEIDITLKVNEVPISQWFSTLSEDGIGYAWYFSTTGDPGEIANAYLREGNSGNYENPEVAGLLADSFRELDEQKRLDLLLEAQRIAIDEDAVLIPLWWGQSLTAFPEDLKLEATTPFVYFGPWPTQFVSAS